MDASTPQVQASQGVLDDHRETATKALEGPKTIETAGYKILAMPLESTALTLEEQKRFQEAGGFEIDCSRMSKEEQIQFAKDNPEVPIDWQVNFKEIKSQIDGVGYTGFDLFKKVYEAFPDIAIMTEDEAILVGLYPVIHYRNFAARKWLAEMHGGYLAILDENFNGQLHDIYNAISVKTNLEKLAVIGQAPFGGRDADDAEVYGLGCWAELGSGPLDVDGYVRGLSARRDSAQVLDNWYGQEIAVSSVIVRNK